MKPAVIVLCGAEPFTYGYNRNTALLVQLDRINGRLLLPRRRRRTPLLRTRSTYFCTEQLQAENADLPVNERRRLSL